MRAFSADNLCFSVMNWHCFLVGVDCLFTKFEISNIMGLSWFSSSVINTAKSCLPSRNCYECPVHLDITSSWRMPSGLICNSISFMKLVYWYIMRREVAFSTV